MDDRIYRVLFLCTGNSARSIIAESILNSVGNGRFKGYSAGSHPSGTVNPQVLELLRAHGMATEAVRSKSWDEFAEPGAPSMDIVITVCDQAAGETCPVWPGHPARARWSAPDPAAWMNDPEKARKVIRDVFHSSPGFTALPQTQLPTRRVRLIDCRATKSESWRDRRCGDTPFKADGWL